MKDIEPEYKPIHIYSNDEVQVEHIQAEHNKNIQVQQMESMHVKETNNVHVQMSENMEAKKNTGQLMDAFGKYDNTQIYHVAYVVVEA